MSGYYTYSYGSTQLEHLYGDVLRGDTPKQQVLAVGQTFSGEDQTGSVLLTLRSDLQELAKRSLAGREGSVVVLDVRTGAVLAMYSNPTYDPNTVAVHDIEAAGAALTALDETPGKPLLANAYQERYMPGSTFKVLTTATALSTGVVSGASAWPDESAWVPPNTNNPIQNYGKKVCGGDLAEVFRRSCNIPFARMSVDVAAPGRSIGTFDSRPHDRTPSTNFSVARMSVDVGPEKLVDGVRSWGLEAKVPIDLPGAATSTFGGDAKSFEDSLALLAIHGFGQGGVQMVPLHMAMVAATVANDGKMMKPYVVDRTLANNGSLLTQTSPEVWRTPISKPVADQLTQLMVGVVNDGTARCCMKLARGVQAAAKTGTAQLNADGEEQRSHAWITAFAPAKAPRVAISVMLKGVNATISAGTGGTLAGPVAKTLLDKALLVVPK